VRTIMPERREAIVNWLCARGASITRGHTDQRIEELFNAERKKAFALVARVKIVFEGLDD